MESEENAMAGILNGVALSLPLWGIILSGIKLLL